MKATHWITQNKKKIGVLINDKFCNNDYVLSSIDYTDNLEFGEEEIISIKQLSTIEYSEWKKGIAEQFIDKNPLVRGIQQDFMTLKFGYLNYDDVIPNSLVLAKSFRSNLENEISVELVEDYCRKNNFPPF